MVKLPVKISLRHRGKVLGLDSGTETMKLLDPTGESLGVVSWDAVIDFIHGLGEETQSHHAVRNYPRSRLAAKVAYVTSDQKHFNGITCEIGGGGIFVETSVPPQLGTVLTLKLLLPDDPTEPITAQGKVSWIRPREEHYAFFPGMGVQFTEISEEGRTRLLTMVKALDHARQGN
jgi:type IV pilus assembly protein PilZ